jgi:hypothetical protein
MEDAIHLPLKGKYYHMIKSGQKPRGKEYIIIHLDKTIKP